MNNKILIFDLDGTLIDPVDAICNSINYALEKKGHRRAEVAELFSFIGMHLAEPFKKITGSNEKKYIWDLIHLYRERYETIGISENRLFDGIREMFFQLDSLNYIASLKPGHASKLILKEFGLKHFFRGVYGSEIDGTRADKGELLQYLKEKENIREAIMIGDRATDVYAAKDCGFASIGVLYGCGSLQEIKKAAPDLLVDKPQNLADGIKELWKRLKK